jgi:DNA-binding MarR family transcriptional regulator
MREAFVALNDLVVARLVERGHELLRPAHGAVFQYLDDTGTTVSVLAERAQMTKQAMAELVLYLESNGYVTRVPDPNDRRAKLVVATTRGHEVMAITQGLVPELEAKVTKLLGVERTPALRNDLEAIRREVRHDSGGEVSSTLAFIVIKVATHRMELPGGRVGTLVLWVVVRLCIGSVPRRA